MHIVQEKDDMADIEKEKCIIKKGIVRKEIERQDNGSYRSNTEKVRHDRYRKRKMYNNERN